MDSDQCVEQQVDIVARLRALLGEDAVLLAIPAGSKRPAIKAWNHPPPGIMENPKYLADLRGGANIGVILGKASGGICTIDMDADDLVEPFLSLNPMLAGTLRTRRSRGCNLWLRVAGEHPALAKITSRDGRDWGEWRADGGQTVIHGVADGIPYTTLVDSPPVEVAFADIRWPDGLDLPWAESAPATIPDEFAALVQERGDPWYLSDDGDLSGVNEAFWAGLYCAEHPGVWEPDEREHFEYNPATGLHEPASPDLVKARVSSRMLEVSRSGGPRGLEARRKDALLRSVESAVRGIREVRAAFEKREPTVHLANGVLVFKHGQVRLESFSPERRSRNGSPIAFDEDATCPRFMEELLLPAVTREDAQLLQRYIGICLLGTNLVQRLLVLDGLAGRGKTTLANVVQQVVGMANVTQLRTSQLLQRFELYRYRRKTLLVGVDVPGDFLSTKGASVLKGLVGGDYLDAEGKGLNGNFQLRGDFCVVVTSNSRLHVHLEGDLGAWNRRLLIVRFEAPPPKRKIPDFAGQLVKQEGAGILNWALAGLGEALRDVEEVGDVRMTLRQAGVVDSLLAESDSLRHFLKDRVEREDGADVATAELVEAYSEYCPGRGWSAFPITVIHEQMDSLMLELYGVTKRHDVKRDGKSVRGYGRVRLTGGAP